MGVTLIPLYESLVEEHSFAIVPGEHDVVVVVNGFKVSIVNVPLTSMVLVTVST